MPSPSTQDRIAFIDIARLYAMAMVFYGHFIERVMLLGDPFAATLYRCIYSFHMLLFFVLSGFIARPGDLAAGIRPYFKYRFFARLLPFIFFTIVSMGLAALLPGDFFDLKLPSIDGYLRGLVMTGLGVPLFCVPSWFLLMIFTVEMVHYFAFKYLIRGTASSGSDARILVAILLFYFGGYYLNLHGDFLNLAKQRMFNVLFVHEAIPMYAFYLVGLYLRRRNFLIGPTPARLAVPAALIALLFVLFTFRLNQGPFNFNYYNAVVIMMSSHGHLFWFPATALAGSLGILLLGKIAPAGKTIGWMGRNTLILMCLNGLFYHHVNPWAGRWVFDHFAGRPGMIFAAGLVMTLASLALCIPFIYLLNRYVPQLVGKPRRHGPWLKALVAP